jgi:hypothetical protein
MVALDRGTESEVLPLPPNRTGGKQLPALPPSYGVHDGSFAAVLQGAAPERVYATRR